MPLEVYAIDNSIIVDNGRNRISITEDDLDNCYAIHVYWGVLEMDDDPVYVLEDPQEAGDIINGEKIRPKPGMVVKNVLNQQVLQYLLGEVVDDKPIYYWHMPGLVYWTTALSDDNYKILDVGEIDD